MAEEESPEKGLISERQRKVREQIEAKIQRAKEEQRREMLQRRIDLARTGLKFYDEKKYKEAVQNFNTYLGVLEDWKGVSPGELTPRHFDAKKDVLELLLINSVYWHLCRLYDRTRGKRGNADFHSFMRKYIQFTKGMSFQPVASEALRKYILTNKAAHMKEFKGAYKEITGNKCFIATSLMDLLHDETPLRLRLYREQKLRPHLAGRALIFTYERVSPPIAWCLDRSPQTVRRKCAHMIERIASAVGV
jgi:hypothetical protein